MFKILKMKKSTVKLAGIICLMELILPGVMAQNGDSIAHYFLDELIISATRTEKKLLEIPKSVNLITQSEIRSSGSTNIAELLSFYEGIIVVGTDLIPGSVQSYFLRGISNEQSTVMIDGIRMSDPSSINNAVDLSEISTSGIQQIEIVKGAHSTMFGSSTIGGLINIITRSKLQPGFHARAFINAGTFGNNSGDFTENLALNYTFRNNFYMSCEIFNRHVNGLDATLDTVRTEGVFKNRDRDNFLKRDLILKTGFTNENTAGFISYKLISNFADIDNGAFEDDENNTLDLTRHMINYSLKHQISDRFEIWANGGLSFVERINENDSSLVGIGAYDHTYYKGRFRGNMISNEIQLEYKTDNITALLGTNMYHESMTSNSFTFIGDWDYESATDLDSLNLNKTLNNFFISTDINGGLIFDQLRFLSIHAGIRYNYENNGSSYITYELSPSVKIRTNSLIFGCISTGFNSPSLYKLYTPESNYISSITRGNPDLEAEKSLSYEAGYKQQVGKNLFFTLSVYKNQINNAIHYVYLWDHEIEIDSLGKDWMRDDYRGDTYLNLGILSTKGVEASIWYNYKNLTLRANLSLQKGSLEFKSDDINREITQGNHVQLYESGRFINTDQSVSTLPRRVNTANMIIKYHFTTNTDVSISARIYGRKSDIYYSYILGPYGAIDTRSLKGYTVLNLMFNQQITNYLSASLKINNLLNTKYEEIIGYRIRGTAVYLGLFLNLDQ